MSRNGQAFSIFLATFSLMSSCSTSMQPTRAAMERIGPSKRLHVQFTGMIIYDPSKGRATVPADDVVFLLVNYPTRKKSFNNPAKFIEAHEGFIAFDANDYVSSSEATISAGPYKYLRLKNSERLTLDPDPKSQVTFYDTGVLRISEICADGASDPAEFSAPTAKSIASVTLKSGMVTIDGETTCDFGFAACAGSVGRGDGRLPNVVDVLITLPLNVTDVRFMDRGKEFLTLRYPRGVTSMTVTIGNAMPDERDAFLQGQASTLTDDLYDVEMYYLLAKNSPSVQPIARRVGSCAKIAGADTCPPARP
jgi:hypothetical protein